MRFKWFAGVMLFTLLLAACSAVQNLQADRSVKGAMDEITLTPSKSAVVGQVNTTYSGQPTPMVRVSVRLAKVFWNEDKSDGAFVLEGSTSPGSYTDERGVFTITNIDPGDYVIVVGEVIGDNEIIAETTGKARIFSAKEGEIIDAGTLVVKLRP